MISSLLLPRPDFAQEKTAGNDPKRQEEQKRSHGLPGGRLFCQQGISPSSGEELPYRCHCLRQQLCGKQDAREEDGGEKEKNGNHRGFRRVFHSQSHNAGNAQRHHQEERQFREILSRVCRESRVKQNWSQEVEEDAHQKQMEKSGQIGEHQPQRQRNPVGLKPF